MSCSAVLLLRAIKNIATAPSATVNRPAAVPTEIDFHKPMAFFLRQTGVSEDLSKAQKCSNMLATSRAD